MSQGVKAGVTVALGSDGTASFLVLEGDPLQDFTNVTRIRSRVKQGVELSAR